MSPKLTAVARLPLEPTWMADRHGSRDYRDFDLFCQSLKGIVLVDNSIVSVSYC